MTALLFSLILPTVAAAHGHATDVPPMAAPAIVIDVPAIADREATRLTSPRSFTSSASSQSRSDRWKCRGKWAVIGAGAGAVTVVVASEGREGGFGPSRAALISLGAIAGGVGGLLLAPDCT